jgi:inner membrane protein
MLFRTHFLFGMLVWFVVGIFVEMPFFVLGFVLLGSVFVDVDSYKSRAGNRWWVRPLQWMTRHRGILHSLVGAVVLSLVVGVFSRWAGFGFFVGYVSHLVLDCFTRMGVGLFWPFSFKVRGFVRSGSWMEDVLFVLLLGVDVLLVFEKLF